MITTDGASALVATRDEICAALDRPAWSALNGPQRQLSVVRGAARRIEPAYGPFAGAEPGREWALAGLLDGPDDQIWLIEPDPLAPPPGTRLVRAASLLQMIADGTLPPVGHDPAIVPLGEADVPEMTALALANRPGPWGPSTWRYGTFFGVRNEGRLVAMAGERLRPAVGLAEVSGVCTAPESRGQGLARRLIRHVMAGFVERGDIPFLHSYAENAGAIALYRALGFRPRRTLTATILQGDGLQRDEKAT